jgi:hypothetical protein
MKQTAVEWLVTHINLGLTYEQEVIFEGLFEKAKEMEKEQIKDAWDKRGDRIVPKYFLKENINGEQYYNETYKKSEQ